MSNTPKCDQALRDAEAREKSAHPFARTNSELQEAHDRLQAPYLDILAPLLPVPREEFRAKLAEAGLALCRSRMAL